MPAARVGDDIAHTQAGLGMLLGIAAGVVAGAVLVGATVATGGAALAVVAAVGGAAGLTSFGGLAGMNIGGAMMGPPCGKFVIGSPNVLINSRPATLTFVSMAACAKEAGAPIPLATGSSTVMINIGMAGREGEKLGCSAVSVKMTSPNVLIGGASAQDPRVAIKPEVPEWAVTALTALGFAGAIMALPFALVTVGFAATVGGVALGYLGGKYGGQAGRAIGESLGMSEAGLRAMEAGGQFLGGMAGGFAGVKGVRAFNSRYQVVVHPNRLGSNLGNVSIVRKPPSARLRYMGGTPSKYSRTGRQVVERMRGQGLIEGEGPLTRGNPNNLSLKNADGSLQRIDHTVDMAHTTDAVSWWNDVGRFHGPKSPEVRQFMLDPDNYILEPRSINRSAGASLGEQYQPPAPNLNIRE